MNSYKNEKVSELNDTSTTIGGTSGSRLTNISPFYKYKTLSGSYYIGRDYVEK